MKTHFLNNKIKNPWRIRAFSLVEVAIAIGIFGFALIPLFALFVVGIQSSKESVNAVSAANLATLLISQRRAMPTSGTSELMKNFALPSLDQASTNMSDTLDPIYLSVNGCKMRGSQDADYGLLYKTTLSSVQVSSTSAQVYIMLFWPASASPKGSSTDRYEISTQIPISK